MNPHWAVVYDSCVLYPAPLRDLLMHLALTDIYRAKWTHRIHDEWSGALLRQRPDLSIQDVHRTRQLMDAHVRDCLVTDFEDLIPSLELPDAGDRHVLAAAIKAEAETIVTFNLSDFPDHCLKLHNVQAQHPDAFISKLISIDSLAVLGAMHRHRISLRHPRKTEGEYRETLFRQGLHETANWLSIGI